MEKFLTRKLNDVRENLEKIKELETQHLEELNGYKELNIDDLGNFEKELQAYIEINELFQILGEFTSDAKSKVENDSQFYNDFVLLNNQILILIDLMNKVTEKLTLIHDKILVKSSEEMSSDILQNLWKGEEDLWDEFYVQSKSN